MTDQQKMRAYLDGYHIATDVADFVSQTSNIYHSYEAENYDERHFSISYSKKYWDKVTAFLDAHFSDRQTVDALDFGCGTGFATEQLLDSKLNSRLRGIACYDLSPDMVAMCRKKFGGDARLSFYADHSGYVQLRDNGNRYDIIVCNALMHHILEPDSVFKMIGDLLKPGGVFVMGHEPNRDFYNNKTLHSFSQLFRIYKRIAKKLGKKSHGAGKDIALLTHQEMLGRGMIPADFPVRIIPKFVDIHVPLANFNPQPWGENGFDLAYVNQYLDGFELVTQITYSHIKDQQAYQWPLWKSMAGWLERIYPKDGADAIFVFKKTS